MKLAVFDAHNDSLTEREDLEALTSRLSDGHWDLVRFAEGGGRWQIAAIFTPPRFSGIEALAYALNHLERALDWVEQHRDKVRLILNKRDLKDDGRIGILLSLEGASPIMGRVEFLRLFFRLGIRCLTLTWNHRNELADGVGVGTAAGGLTKAGKAIVAECERLGIAVDVSHLSERSFWDLMKVATKPVFASHSNFRSLCDHPRNLTDEQAEAIADKGGVICLTFVPAFVGGDLAQFVRHYFHGVELVSEKALGLGSDFDGCKNPVLPDASAFPQLAQVLRQSGVSSSALKSLFHANLLRYFRKILPE
ncbi:dipeptidase [Fervidibacter sacchari]|uniref:Membrane dipeptidase n=1 Tax=Candidatus Fervidibacter sacchari TaxID=1448929 RepID=A0ABT2EQY4_9BACT|nr:dipeptidase [Candidatus Fervidibacter sacchari]MCS3919315.1 membrane dipeptidase [Candidatus Fervidibacter sacchari]WKU15052.1 dipeptidase [Candidatus Fervidibacter sacchari]